MDHPSSPTRVDITDEALALLTRLQQRHGPVMFHQSGGCCDGSSPMCYPLGDFLLGESDVHLGWVGDAPFHMSAAQFAYWAHTHLTVDVVPGRGAGFSLEAPEGGELTDVDDHCLVGLARRDEAHDAVVARVGVLANAGGAIDRDTHADILIVGCDIEGGHGAPAVPGPRRGIGFGP